MWNPPMALTPEEHKIAARTRKARKFFVFVREHRHELLEDIGKSLAQCGSWMDGVKETTPHQGESVASSSRAPYFRLSFVDHVRYIQQHPRHSKQHSRPVSRVLGHY